MVNVARAGDTIDFIDFCASSSSSAATSRAPIPFGTNSRYSQQLVHALPNDRILLARHGAPVKGGDLPAPLLLVCNLKAVRSNASDQSAWVDLSAMLPLTGTIAPLLWHPLSASSPVFAIVEDAGTLGSICTIFATTDGRDLKIISKFPVPVKRPELSIVVDYQPERPTCFTIVGHLADEPPGSARQVLIVDEKGQVKARMVEPKQSWRKSGQCFAAVRADGTAALLFSILAGGQSHTAVYHVSLAATEPAVLEPKLVSKGNDHFLCMAPVPATGRTGSSPLFLCGISGLGKIQLIDPFDILAQPDRRRTAKDWRGYDIPFFIGNDGPHANVIYVVMPKTWGKRANTLTMRGRYAVVSLDETAALFDWTTGEYLWRYTVAPNAHADDSPIDKLHISPDGCSFFACLHGGRYALWSTHQPVTALPVPEPATGAPGPTPKKARVSEKPLFRGRDHD